MWGRLLHTLQAELHMSHTEAVLPITLYVLGFGLGWVSHISSWSYAVNYNL